MPAPFPLPTNDALVAVAEAAATASAITTPVLCGLNNSRMRNRLYTTLDRIASVGGGTVKGAKLAGLGPIPEGRDTDNTSKGVHLLGSDDGIGAATGRSYLIANIPFTALSGNNWACLFYDASAGTWAFLEKAASAATTAGQFFIETYDSGNQVKLTIGASAAGGNVADNDEVYLWYIDSEDVLTLASYTNAELAPSYQEADGPADIAWLEADDTESPSAINVYLKPVTGV